MIDTISQPVEAAASKAAGARIYKQIPNDPAEAGPKAAPALFFLREWSSEIDSLIAAARHIRGAVEAARFVAMGHLAPRRQAPSSRQLVE